MNTIKTNLCEFTFNKNYYILISNNGNHHNNNRIWNVYSNGFNTKKKALNELNHLKAENDDMKYGLTYSQIVTPNELIEIINSDNKVNIINCYDIAYSNNSNLISK
jgi:hypothetical protein